MGQDFLDIQKPRCARSRMKNKLFIKLRQIHRRTGEINKVKKREINKERKTFKAEQEFKKRRKCLLSLFFYGMWIKREREQIHLRNSQEQFNITLCPMLSYICLANILSDIINPYPNFSPIVNIRIFKRLDLDF